MAMILLMAVLTGMSQRRSPLTRETMQAMTSLLVEASRAARVEAITAVAGIARSGDDWAHLTEAVEEMAGEASTTRGRTRR